MTTERYSGTAGDAWIYDAEAVQWLCCSAPERVIGCRTLEEVLPALADVERLVKEQGWYAVGFVSYEAAPACDAAILVRSDPDPPPLCWFALYRSVRPVSRPVPPGSPPSPGSWHPSVDGDSYARAIAMVRDYIREGDTYQVNYTFRLRSNSAQSDPFARFASMLQAQPDGYGAYIDCGRWVIASASPELFFSYHRDRLVSKPMKGTASRGVTLEQDLARARELAESEKCQAENVMIVDMVRNDLGRVALPGSVVPEALFETERYPTIWQMTSTVGCTSHAALPDLFKALFPPASITGAPKVHTCELIAELESSPRRIYTGSVGLLRPDGYMQFNVAIRTLLVDRDRGCAEYGIGSGIVWDSETVAEYEECLAKARILTDPPPCFCLLETMQWDGREVRNRGYHLARIARSAAYFGYPFDPVQANVEIDAAVEAAAPVRVRLTLAQDGRLVVEIAPLPSRTDAPVRVCMDCEPVDRNDPFLYHKTTFRQRYAAARERFPEVDDVILWNGEGHVTESTIATVAIERDGVWVTPPIADGLLAGTMRQAMLDAGALTEGSITLDELREAPAIYLINSLRGVRRAELER